MIEVLHYLEQKAREGEDPSWQGYTLILKYLYEANKRLPALPDIEGIDGDAIDSLLESEIEKIAELVSKLLPGGIQELENYHPDLK